MRGLVAPVKLPAQVAPTHVAGLFGWYVEPRVGAEAQVVGHAGYVRLCRQADAQVLPRVAYDNAGLLQCPCVVPIVKPARHTQLLCV